MSEKDERAFPNAYNFGLTKREYYAAIALQGIIACGGTEYRPEERAKNAVAYADALLKALASG